MSQLQMQDYMPSDFFSRQTLEKSIHLLKKDHSALAHCILNALEQTPIVPYENLVFVYTGEMVSNTELIEKLKPHVIGRIVSCLTDIGQKILMDKKTSDKDILSLRSIIEDWMQLMEWILSRTNTDQQDCTNYQ
ncbi:MAG: hypothetical protein IPK77_02460 [Cellvibrio sp.]|nr:hypothetical protein [Cellvibrio sp.]